MSGETDRPDLGERLIGYVLVTGGVLIALLSGACSLAVLATVSGSAARGGADSYVSSLVMVAVFGGLPFLVGCSLIAGGRALLRRPRRRLDTEIF